MRNTINFFIIFFLIACENSEARLPENLKSDDFIKNSAKKNKKLNNYEYNLIKNYIELSNKDYRESNYGFWYYKEIKKNNTNNKLRFGDKIYFKFTVKDLEDKIIYSDYKSKNKIYFMEQEPIISGLREGLKLMHEGEKMTFIFPSQIAYGFRGDQKKIKPNSPLVYEVIIDKIVYNDK